MVGLLLAAVAVSWADTGTSDTGASVHRVTGTNTHTGAWAVHTAHTGATPTGESGGSGHSGGGTTETDTDTDTDTDEPTDGTTDGTTDDTATGDDKSCGCATPGSGAAPAVLLGILAARRRRAR